MEPGAVYEVALATKGGGPAAVAAATLGTRAVLPAKVETSFLVREVGPTLLDIHPAPSEIPEWLCPEHGPVKAGTIGVPGPALLQCPASVPLSARKSVMACQRTRL